MTVQELINYLQSDYCPKDAEVMVFDDTVYPYPVTEPQVVWWSDDRKTVFLGKL